MTNVDLLLMVSGGRPLLSLTELAKVLDRSPAGLRLTLAGDSDLARKLLPARKKLGRRVYFSVIDVARCLDEATS